jgi:hypothetical protein
MALEGLFGPIFFGRGLGAIRTFYEIKRAYKGRFAKHMIHMNKPLTEWAGNDLVEISLRMSLNSVWCGDPNRILAEFHAMHMSAMAAPLIVGFRPMGPPPCLFIIKSLSESHKHWLPGGRLIAVELDVDFEEYMPFAAENLPGIGGAAI